MIILTGPSASGKTATCLYLQEHYGIKKVITHTTREIRVGEQNDVDYHFVTKEEFLKLKEKDYFIETVIYNGNYYGTSKPEVSIDKCMAVELNGAKSYRGLNNDHIVIFYMKANEALRLARMNERGDDPEKIKSRIANDKSAFSDENDLNGLIDCTVDTEKYNIEQAAEFIYKKYIEILNSRGIKYPIVEKK